MKRRDLLKLFGISPFIPFPILQFKSQSLPKNRHFGWKSFNQHIIGDIGYCIGYDMNYEQSERELMNIGSNKKFTMFLWPASIKIKLRYEHGSEEYFGWLSSYEEFQRVTRHFQYLFQHHLPPQFVCSEHERFGIDCEIKANDIKAIDRRFLLSSAQRYGYYDEP